MLYLCYPTSTVNVIWVATIHYQLSCLFVLLCMSAWITYYRQKKRMYLVLSLLAYLGSLLVIESYAFLPLGLVFFYPFMEKWSGEEGAKHFMPFAGLFGVWLLWHEKLLFLYGGWTNYTVEPLSPVGVTRKMATGLGATMQPWVEVVSDLSEGPGPWIVMIPFIVFALIGVAFWHRRSSIPAKQDPDDYLRPMILGLVFLAAGVLPMAVSDASGYVISGPGARYLFSGAIGGSLLFVSLLLWGMEKLSTSPSPRFLRWMGILGVVIFVGSLMGWWMAPRMEGKLVPEAVRFLRFFFFGEIWDGLAIVLLALLWWFVIRREDIRKVIAQWVGSVIFGAAILMGGLVHNQQQHRYAEEWREHRVFFKQLTRVIPDLQDGTFLIIDGLEESRVITGLGEMSTALIGLYNNPSIMGCPDWQLRYGAEGIRATYFGRSYTWRFPGNWGKAYLSVRGPGETMKEIPYENVVLIRWEEGGITLMEKIKVRKEGGGEMVIRSQKNRILKKQPERGVFYEELIRE